MTSDIHSPSSDPCPTFDELQAFNRGQLDVPALDSISRHLQSCERCALLLLSVSDAASAAYEAAAEDGADRSTPPSRGDATHRHPTQAVDAAATVSLAADSIPTVIGRYTVLRILGTGGFGVVYLARDAELGRLVAIKAPHAQRIQRAGDLDAYRREARLLASVDHVHIVPIYDVGAADDTPFFVVSKFVPGIDLAARLRAAPPDFRTSAEWVATLAEALDHVHRQGLIHRDVKPRNIMVDPAGRVYLMDFGLAKRAASQKGAEPIVGTPAYMAPEQARGEPLDGRCDVYALGMVLYELLTGQRPFKGDASSIMQHVLATDPPLPRSVKRSIPRDLEAICVKALAKDRERRYRTAAELAEDLRHWLRDEPLRFARRVGPLERAWSWTKRHRAVATLGGVAVVAIVLSGFAWIRSPGNTTFAVTATVTTQPAEANVCYWLIDKATGLPSAERRVEGKAGQHVRLSPGYHLLVVVWPDGRFHEVFRYVPTHPEEASESYRHSRYENRGGIVHLRPIEAPVVDPLETMALLPAAGRFALGPTNAPLATPVYRSVPSFYLDPKEVTVGEFIKVRKNFRFPKDAPVPPDDWPITHVNWDDAVAYAEVAGNMNGLQRRLVGSRPWRPSGLRAGRSLSVASRLGTASMFARSRRSSACAPTSRNGPPGRSLIPGSRAGRMTPWFAWFAEGHKAHCRAPVTRRPFGSRGTAWNWPGPRRGPAWDSVVPAVSSPGCWQKISA
jgi:hypothetical protein